MGPTALALFFRAAPPLGRDVRAFQAGNGLLEALGGVAVAGIVACVLVADARDLLLKGGKALELGLAHIGKTIGALLELTGKVRHRAEAIDEVGELLRDFFLRASGIEKGDALERAVAHEPVEEFAVTACGDPFRDAFSCRLPVLKDDARHRT